MPDYPDIKIHAYFDVMGETVRAVKPNFVLKYRAYIEDYPDQRQSFGSIGRLSSDIFEDLVDGVYNTELPVSDAVRRCVAESAQLAEGVIQLLINLQDLPEGDRKALDERMEGSVDDLYLWLLKELRLPKYERDEYEYEAEQIYWIDSDNKLELFQALRNHPQLSIITGK